MAITKRSYLLAACVVALLAGCDGHMSGMVRGSGERVNFAYKMELYSDQLGVTLADGENFNGKAVPVGGNRTTGTSTTRPADKKDPQSKATVSSKVSETTTGEAEAVLFGDKGRSMRCNLKYADKGGAIVLGGLGTCTVSDGKIIDVSW